MVLEMAIKTLFFLQCQTSNDTHPKGGASFLATPHTPRAFQRNEPPQSDRKKMEPATPEASDWATDRVTALPEFWTLVAEHSGIVGAWRLTGVCTAAREGAKGWLRTLPRYSSRDWWLLLPFTFTG